MIKGSEKKRVPEVAEAKNEARGKASDCPTERAILVIPLAALL
jgi:hypothetical protein